MKCKHCKKEIGDKPYQQIQFYQVHKECLSDFIQSHYKKATVKRKKKETKVKKKFKKVEDRVKKKKAKKIAWKWFSKYTRLRDARKNGIVKCISCERTIIALSRKCHAGHYIPKSRGEYFYFKEDNVHAQCQQCNMFGSQDTGANYERNLRKKIGDKAVDDLIEKSHKVPTLKRTTKDYRAIADYYRVKFNRLNKRI